MREDLRLVARGHSEDMVARDFFAHVNPDGVGGFYYTQVFIGISKDVSPGLVEIYYDEPLALPFD